MPGWTGEDSGIRWELALERDDLLPGRLVPGTVRVEARDDVSARRLLVTLRGVERWKYEVTVSDGDVFERHDRQLGELRVRR